MTNNIKTVRTENYVGKIQTNHINTYFNFPLNQFIFKETKQSENKTKWNFCYQYITYGQLVPTNLHFFGSSFRSSSFFLKVPFFENQKNLMFDKIRYVKEKEPIFVSFKRQFGGRSGGLKRKKTKKVERIINTCAGKRLEFFYPKKKRRQRIRLIQNSRKNIVYDNVLKRFLVYYYKQGIQVFRSFSTKKKQNFEAAKNKAILLSKQLDKRYKKKEENKKVKDEQLVNINNSDLAIKYNSQDLIGKQITVIPDKNKSGYRGVFYDSTYHAYICVYNEAGIRKFQIFKIKNNNYLEAYHLAVMCRRYKLFKNFQFVAQRNRMRSGKCYLK